MSFGQLIKQVQHGSGLSYAESKEAVIMYVEGLAARLTDKGRMKFAARLPDKLQDIALSVYPMNPNYDIVAHFMYYQNIGKVDAKKKIDAARKAINQFASEPYPMIFSPNQHRAIRNTAF